MPLDKHYFEVECLVASAKQHRVRHLDEVLCRIRCDPTKSLGSLHLSRETLERRNCGWPQVIGAVLSELGRIRRRTDGYRAIRKRTNMSEGESDTRSKMHIRCSELGDVPM